MWDIIFKVAIVFLLIYFVCDFFKKVVEIKRNNDRLNTVIVVRVKNREEDIERIVRSLIWKCLKVSNGGYIPYIMIVDMGSQDNTLDIAKKLNKEYDFIIPMTYDEYLKLRSE